MSVETCERGVGALVAVGYGHVATAHAARGAFEAAYAADPECGEPVATFLARGGK